MNRIVLSLLFFTPLACLADELDSAGTKLSYYFDSTSILKFADDLYDDGDYLRAAGEYRRYLFSRGSSSGSDSIYYRMAKALFLGHDCRGCDQFLSMFADRYPGSAIAADVPLYRSIVKFHQADYNNSLVLAQSPGIRNLGLVPIVMGLDHLHMGDYEAAERCVCTRDAPDTLSTDNSQAGYAIMGAYLCEKARAAESMALKSKFRAGLYSALVPGTGKIYLGRVADGIYSFIVIGLAAWQAYDGFAESGTNSGKGWIFAVLGGGFYLGNIYGSMMAADLHNREARADFLNGLRIELTLP